MIPLARLSFHLGRWVVPLLLLALAPLLRTPLMFNSRYLWLVLICQLAIVALGWLRGQGRRGLRLRQVLPALILLAAASVAVAREAQFQRARWRVLHAPAERLRRVGRHVVVGYTSLPEVRRLVASGAVAGLYVTARNVRHKTAGQVRRELASLQRLRRRQGMPRLLVAADQEGGEVSHLAPPLSPMPPLSSLLAGAADARQLRGRVRRYAEVHGRELSRLGINANFGPVVDLRLASGQPIVDLHSRISERAIAVDPRLVNEVARTYSQTLWRHGVRATLKHFPGLGRVPADTHYFAARLDLPVARLEREDWLPFRQVSRQTPALIMLAHVTLTRVDPAYPVSSSPAVVQGLIRGRWGHQGPLITDDYCMWPAWRARGGLAASVTRTVNAGVDLVLVSSDVQQVYVVLAALLEADARGELRGRAVGLPAPRLIHSPDGVETPRHPGPVSAAASRLRPGDRTPARYW